jgi:hypothetical protein
VEIRGTLRYLIGKEPSLKTTKAYKEVLNSLSTPISKIWLFSELVTNPDNLERSFKATIIIPTKSIFT